MNSSQISSEMNTSINIYDSYYFNQFFGKELRDIIEDIIKNCDEEWGFPLEFNSHNKNFYSSVTSTILLALHSMNLLDQNFKNKIYESIFRLQNQSPNLIKKQKSKDDSPAWDVSESANCYSTSLALQALIETDYKGSKTDIIKESLIWLSQQQKGDGGWGFDKTCVSRVYFSAQIIYTLSIGLKFVEPTEKSKIEAAISTGLNFIKSEMRVEKNKFTYWSAASGDNIPEPTNTLYALWILNKQNILDDNVKNSALCFLREQMNYDNIWDFSEVVKEINSKYGSNKTIISFSPSFPLILLELGVSPFDDLCLKPISWLKDNFKNYWSLPQYSSGNLSFIYVLGLWTLIKWQRHANKHVLINGFDNKKISNLKRRINFYVSIVLLMIFIQLRTPIMEIITSIYKVLNQELAMYGKIPFYASLITIVLFIVTVIKYIPIVVKYIDTKVFQSKIKITLNKLKLRAYIIIYGV